MLRPKLNRIWTSTNANLRRDPGDAKYIQGWISEIPTYQVLNYLQYKVDTTLLAMAERGIFEWGSDVTYGLASVVWDELDKKIYVSTVGVPDKTKAPSTNPAHWSPSSIQVTRASYDNIANAINTHIADITGNPHKLTAGRLNAYNKNETDAIVAQYRALVLAHSSDKNNPHGVTATQTGAVPATGGTYSGDVTFLQGMFFDAAKTKDINKIGGLFLRNGSYQIGIHDLGKGVITSPTVTSTIVTEEQYPTLKMQQEPDYAVPAPVYQLDLMRNIHIQHGDGKVGTDFEPTFAQNGAMQISNTGAIISMSGSSQITATKNYTIAFDILEETPRIVTDQGNSFFLGFQDGGQSAYIYLTGTSLIKAERHIGSTYETIDWQLVGPINSWYRVVATFKGSEIRLFVNGVERVSKLDAIATADVVGGALSMYANQKPPEYQRLYDVRNVRFWSEALTPKQISNL